MKPIAHVTKVNRWLFLLAAACLLGMALAGNVLAQKKKNKKDKKSGEASGDLMLYDFASADTASILKLPQLNFPDVNKITDYYDPARLAAIERYKKNKQWDEFLVALYDYVGRFGIGNFIYDMDLVWQLARVAEYKEQRALSRELYRLILKHYRGSLRDAIVHYDSVAGIDLPRFANLEDYYRMVEKRMLVDTLQPPARIMLDMGEGVNSPWDDYGLTITGEHDNKIYFTSSRSLDTSRALVDIRGGVSASEDIYISEKDLETDEWQVAAPFEPINSSYKEGSPCMSKDGTTIVFSRCNSPDGLGNCDLYIAEYNQQEGTWSPARNLGQNINSYAWDSHPAFSITEDTLYFSSDRKGGFGGTDIYYSVRNRQTGQWNKARNLGPIVNTRDSEVSPYPHPRYNVLYFSSNGHIVRFGDFDIFKTYQVDGHWTEPRNVGPLVNGEASEFYFTIDSRSKWLFYAKSSQPEGSNLDLKSFPLPMEAKPNSIIRFSGRIIEPVTGEVFQGTVTIIDLDEGVEVAPRKIRPDGTFEFELIDKRNYLLMVEGDNFFKIEEIFYLEGDMDMEVEVQSVHRAISFDNIDFDPNSSELKPEMENNLHLIIEFLVDNPEFNLIITGHTDTVGDSTFNLQLSQNRADVIRDYIISYGNLEKPRVTSVGKGESEPIVLNEVTEMDRKLNRRVEFELYRPGESRP